MNSIRRSPNALPTLKHRIRASTLSIYLDENVSNEVRDALAEHSRRIVTTHEAGMKGATDTEQLIHATNLRAMILTQDIDFVDLHATNAVHRGIARFPHMMRGADVAARLMAVLAVIPKVQGTLLQFGWQSCVVRSPGGHAHSIRYPDARAFPNRMPPLLKETLPTVGKHSKQAAKATLAS